MASDKITVWLDKDERWPEVIVSTEASAYMTEVKISRRLLERHAKALAEFETVQGLLFAQLVKAKK